MNICPTHPSSYGETRSGIVLPLEYVSTAPIGLDLFCGCGGFSLGMEWGGIDVAAAVEMGYQAAASYMFNLAAPDCTIMFDTEEREQKWEAYLERGNQKRHKARKRRKQAMDRVEDLPDVGAEGWVGANRPDLQREHRPDEAGGQMAMTGRGCRGFYLGDIKAVTAQDLEFLAGVDRFDVMFGGPPCQGLSTMNSKACIQDPRNGLLWEFLRIVEEGQPDQFVIENVPQILTAGKGALFRILLKRANEIGYNVVASVLDAANFGVPQHRRRAFIVGTLAESQERPFSFPMPTTWALGRTVDGESWAFTDEQGKNCGKTEIDVTDTGGIEYDPESQTFQEVKPKPPPAGELF